MTQQAPGSKQRIVVGVDGSEHSHAALAWAARQAELTGALLQTVTAWEYPQFYGMYDWAPDLKDPGPEQIAERLAHDAVDAVLGPDPKIPLKIQVGQGSAARVLTEAARGAALRVVGSRGYGAFAGALLGSVSQHVAHHASCPVVIVRGEED